MNMFPFVSNSNIYDQQNEHIKLKHQNSISCYSYLIVDLLVNIMWLEIDLTFGFNLLL